MLSNKLLLRLLLMVGFSNPFNSIFSMERKIAISHRPVSEFAREIIRGVYSIHKLKDKGDALDFYISGDPNMLAEKNHNDAFNQIFTNNSTSEIARINDSTLVLVSPALHKMIESCSFTISYKNSCEKIQKLKSHPLVSFYLLYMLAYKTLRIDEKNLENEEFILKQAQQIAISQMYTGELDVFKKKCEKCISFIQDGTLELVAQELKKRENLA